MTFPTGMACASGLAAAAPWYGSPAGGVAYIGNFISGVANTVYVFPDALGKNEKPIAEASSHESGHAFGLQHQSLFDVGRHQDQRVQPRRWRLGADYGGQLLASTQHLAQRDVVLGAARTLQDDLAVITKPENGFGFRPDDHADSVGSGTPLLLTGNNVSGAGIIEFMTDVDAFSFATDAGTITLTANVASLGPNLDAVIELRDSVGGLVASASPSGDLNATISTTVIAGDYTLLVKSTGEYGRIGQYTVSGTVNAGLFVIDHTPAEGSVVSTLVTDFEIDFSEPIDLLQLSNAELFVNGISADSVSVVDGDTLAFHFLASPISSEGVQQMTMAAGSVVTAADSSPLNEFLGTFRYDSLPLAITSTTPLDGATATLPLVSLQLNLNEQYGLELGNAVRPGAEPRTSHRCHVGRCGHDDVRHQWRYCGGNAQLLPGRGSLCRRLRQSVAGIRGKRGAGF